MAFKRELSREVGCAISRIMLEIGTGLSLVRNQRIAKQSKCMGGIACPPEISKWTWFYLMVVRCFSWVQGSLSSRAGLKLGSLVRMYSSLLLNQAKSKPPLSSTD